MESNNITTTIEELLKLRQETVGFDLRAHKKVLTAMAGGHKSSFRGRGIDFDEVRIYQPGDEVRSIDWRVTARRGKPHTKIFREERERPIYVVLDQRKSLFFGSKLAFKSVTAARLAAMLAWASIDNNDRVGGLLFSDQQHLELRPREGKNGVLRLLKAIVEYNQALPRQFLDKSENQTEAESNTLASTLLALNRVMRPGSLVFIISDFYDFDRAAIQQLQALNRHNDMISILVYDPLEKQPPPPGRYQFTNGNNVFSLNTAYREQRNRYSEIFQQRVDSIKNEMGKLGCPLVEISTEDDVGQALRLSLGMRARRRTSRR